MKRILLFILFGILFHDGIYAKINRDDSIYHDLCLFLVRQNIITEQYMSGNKEDYFSLLVICDILEEYVPKKKPDLSKEFGIYNFNYIGHESDWIFLLIKYKNNYRVFRRFETNVIINEILKIRDEDPTLIDDVLFGKYLKEITDYKNQGIKVMYKTGKIQFITKSP
jgi:hypothetical protein